jgi:hypothetical protein
MMTAANPVLPVSEVTARRSGRSWIVQHPVVVVAIALVYLTRGRLGRCPERGIAVEART